MASGKERSSGRWQGASRRWWVASGRERVILPMGSQISKWNSRFSMVWPGVGRLGTRGWGDAETCSCNDKANVVKNTI